MAIKYKEGDIFAIQTRDGRYAICQVVCAFKGDFRKAVSFGVLCVSDTKEIPADSDFLDFDDYRGSFKIIFASSTNIKRGDWEVLGHIPLSTEKQAFRIYQCAGHLYRGDEYVKHLDIAEYRDYITLSVAGNELVQNYLDQLGSA
ncbi:MAG: immunity 26/phosphotriesterase HocA family protein [Corticimicrobacter sp.]|uniref:immunity 26/phosphotriesterase HocA family protein n=1 Tax=Corticimicrobacter sp. TaxID=2678536 RepID=UPI0032DA58F7